MWSAMAEACTSNSAWFSLAHKGLCLTEARVFNTFFSNEVTNTVTALTI